MGYQSAARLASLPPVPGDHFAMLKAALGPAIYIRRVEVTSLDGDFRVAVPLTMVADGHIRARVRRREPGAYR
ncbi:hypothetical protein O6P37_02480 [Mycobacterium sp. CPCC 205372]|uniref:Uncharacterized protein n=1 Tax=Mycobacterium hippophais TaxID=3016340 RepID=A0ABT4PMC8_9MYCO|nr:hypothetical protein [Mycobacterium hippophais]MCZ8377719.1 hypothetical protein [Mycobacterium hippophais]